MLILPSYSDFCHSPIIPLCRIFAKRFLATPVFLRPSYAYTLRVFTRGEIIHLYNSRHLSGFHEYLRL